MDIKIGTVVRMKTYEEMQEYKKTMDREYYRDSTGCGWLSDMKNLLGKKLIISSLEYSKDNFKVKGYNGFLSPDWCKPHKALSFNSIYKDLA